MGGLNITFKNFVIIIFQLWLKVSNFCRSVSSVWKWLVCKNSEEGVTAQSDTHHNACKFCRGTKLQSEITANLHIKKKKLYKRKITKKNLLYHLIQSVQSIGFISSQLIIRFAYQNCKFKNNLLTLTWKCSELITESHKLEIFK